MRKYLNLICLLMILTPALLACGQEKPTQRGQPPDVDLVIETLVGTEERMPVDLLYGFLGWQVEESRSFLLADGELKPYEEKLMMTTNGMVPVNRLDGVYQATGIADIEGLQDAFGQYLFHTQSNNEEIFVFNGYSEKEMISKTNIFISQDEGIQQLSYNETGRYRPYAHYWDSNHYYLIDEPSFSNTEVLLGKPDYKVRDINLATLELKSSDIVYQNIVHDGRPLQILVRDGIMYTLIDEYVTSPKAGEEQQDLSDCVIAIDLHSAQQRKMILPSEKVAMIFWNNEQLMAGWFEQEGADTSLILHPVAFKDAKADLRIVLPLEWARLSQNQVLSWEGKLYLPLASRQGNHTVVIDLSNGKLDKLLSLNELPGRENMNVRYVQQYSEGYYDLQE